MNFSSPIRSLLADSLLQGYVFLCCSVLIVRVVTGFSWRRKRHRKRRGGQGWPAGLAWMWPQRRKKPLWRPVERRWPLKSPKLVSCDMPSPVDMERHTEWPSVPSTVCKHPPKFVGRKEMYAQKCSDDDFMEKLWCSWRWSIKTKEFL